ncbi:hypothetical protein EMCRGX_G002864 [Ephydatia muelleri]
MTARFRDETTTMAEQDALSITDILKLLMETQRRQHPMGGVMRKHLPKGPGETYREQASRLQDVAKKWLKGCTTMEELLDTIVKE